MARKVFLACCFGGGVGAFVALQLWQPLWWVGLLVGGFVGYLTYEFKAVIHAIPQAWTSAVGVIGSRLQYAFRDAIHIAVNVTNIAPGSLLIVVPAVWYYHDIRVAMRSAVIMIIIALAAATVLGMSAVFFSLIGGELPGTPLYNPLWVYGYYLPRAIYSALRSAPEEWKLFRSEMAGLGRLLWRFFWHLFRLIHSDLRLLCGLDAALGSAIGYFSGNALIGALAGGLIGVANFEIVSKRVLHLVPSR